MDGWKEAEHHWALGHQQAEKFLQSLIPGHQVRENYSDLCRAFALGSGITRKCPLREELGSPHQHLYLSILYARHYIYIISLHSINPLYEANIQRGKGMFSRSHNYQVIEFVFGFSASNPESFHNIVLLPKNQRNHQSLSCKRA